MLIILYNSIIYKSAFNQALIWSLNTAAHTFLIKKVFHFLMIYLGKYFVVQSKITKTSFSFRSHRMIIRPSSWYTVLLPGQWTFFNIAIISIAFLMELWPPEFLSHFTKYITFCSLSHETLRRLDLGVTQCIL